MSTESTPKLLTRAEAAASLRVSENTIDRWIRKGILSAIKPEGGGRGRVLIPEAEIARLVAKGWRETP